MRCVKGDVEPMDIDPPEDERELAREFISKTFYTWSSNKKI